MSAVATAEFNVKAANVVLAFAITVVLVLLELWFITCLPFLFFVPCAFAFLAHAKLAWFFVYK